MGLILRYNLVVVERPMARGRLRHLRYSSESNIIQPWLLNVGLLLVIDLCRLIAYRLAASTLDIRKRSLLRHLQGLTHMLACRLVPKDLYGLSLGCPALLHLMLVPIELLLIATNHIDKILLLALNITLTRLLQRPIFKAATFLQTEDAVTDNVPLTSLRL